MGCVELLEAIAQGPEMTQVLACLVVAKNMIAGISIRKVDVPIEPHRDRRWIELLEIQSRLLRILEPQDHLAGRCVCREDPQERLQRAATGERFGLIETR